MSTSPPAQHLLPDLQDLQEARRPDRVVASTLFTRRLFPDPLSLSSIAHLFTSGAPCHQTSARASALSHWARLFIVLRRIRRLQLLYHCTGQALGNVATSIRDFFGTEGHWHIL
jgi:hypothetical protein